MTLFAGDFRPYARSADRRRIGQVSDSSETFVQAMESEMVTTLDGYTGAQAPVEAQSSQPLSGGRGPHSRIPERKQVNRLQAFIIASSLWPFRWPARAVHARKGK